MSRDESVSVSGVLFFGASVCAEGGLPGQGLRGAVIREELTPRLSSRWRGEWSGCGHCTERWAEFSDGGVCGVWRFVEMV